MRSLIMETHYSSQQFKKYRFQETAYKYGMTPKEALTLYTAKFWIMEAVKCKQDPIMHLYDRTVNNPKSSYFENEIWYNQIVTLINKYKLHDIESFRKFYNRCKYEDDKDRVNRTILRLYLD